MTERFFTVDEANEALAGVRPLAERMVAHRRAQAAAAAGRARVSGRIAGNGGGEAAREAASAQAELDREAEAVARCVEELTGLGVQVKDLDRGLVDFPAIRGDEVVLLCWHVGEDEIAYWHGEHEGFAGRRALPL